MTYGLQKKIAMLKGNFKQKRQRTQEAAEAKTTRTGQHAAASSLDFNKVLSTARSAHPWPPGHL